MEEREGGKGKTDVRGARSDGRGDEGKGGKNVLSVEKKGCVGNKTERG